MIDELRLPPQDLTAERSLLGSLLLDNAKFSEVSEIITAADFYFDIHGQIYRAIDTLLEIESVCDIVMLARQLECQEVLEEIGGPLYLNEILMTVPISDHAVYYARIVAGCSRQRKQINVGRQLIEDSYDSGKDQEQARQAAQLAATSLAEIQPTGKADKIRPLTDHMDEMLTNLEAGISPTKRDGIPAIDEMISGTCGGEVIVIAAATHHGKTLLGLQWLHESAGNGVTCGMISEEMSALSIASRSFQTLTCIPREQWLKETNRLRFDFREYKSRHAPILMAEKCGSIAAAERAISEMVRLHSVNVVAVDYAQLIRGEGSNKQERVADVSGRLKQLTMKYDLRLILLAQLNRQIDLRDDPAPQLSDIRDSGAIAMDADIVLMPFHPHTFDSEYSDSTEYRVYIRKNRNRGIKSEVLKMRLDKDRQRIFVDEYQPELTERAVREWT